MARPGWLGADARSTTAPRRPSPWRTGGRRSPGGSSPSSTRPCCSSARCATSPGWPWRLHYQEYGSDASFPYGDTSTRRRDGESTCSDGWMVHTSAVVETGGILNGVALRLLLTGIAVSLAPRAARLPARHRSGARPRQLDDRTRRASPPGPARRIDRAAQPGAWSSTGPSRCSSGTVATTPSARPCSWTSTTSRTSTTPSATGRVTSSSSRSPPGWRAALRGGDTIGRMGGDEFVVLLDGNAAGRRARTGRGAAARRAEPALRALLTRRCR